MLKPINLPDSFKLQCSTCDDDKSFVVTALCGGMFGRISCLPVINSAAHICAQDKSFSIQMSFCQRPVYAALSGAPRSRPAG